MFGISYIALSGLCHRAVQPMLVFIALGTLNKVPFRTSTDFQIGHSF